MTATGTRKTMRAGRRTTARVARNRWGDGFARFGIATRAAVYLILGYLVVGLALDSSGDRQGSTSRGVSPQGALRTVADEPGGRIGLAILVVGLVGYAVFSVIDAVLHHNDDPSPMQRWVLRLRSLGAAGLYGGLAGWSASVVASPSSKGSSARSQQASSGWTARLLSWPLGPELVGLLGVVIAVAGGILVHNALTESFDERFPRRRIGARTWLVIQVLGTVGYIARGVVFLIVGAVIFSAAVTGNPARGQGVDGSLRLLARQWFGPYLLFPVAFGLLTYGIYLCFEARFRKV
ncbi:MAG TPA: DUF1206 domain-containing protein [Mycobacteriales bacterium]|nr:DUF1206 domain-containing protein [Mycobacteriales bacterium]